VVIERRHTVWFLAAWAAVLVVYAVLALALGGERASVSRVLNDLCCEHPVVVALIFLFLGHAIWPQWRN
jgi:hypothetical protein